MNKFYISQKHHNQPAINDKLNVIVKTKISSRPQTTRNKQLIKKQKDEQQNMTLQLALQIGLSTYSPIQHLTPEIGREQRFFLSKSISPSKSSNPILKTSQYSRKLNHFDLIKLWNQREINLKLQKRKTIESQKIKNQTIQKDYNQRRRVHSTRSIRSVNSINDYIDQKILKTARKEIRQREDQIVQIDRNIQSHLVRVSNQKIRRAKILNDISRKEILSQQVQFQKWKNQSFNVITPLKQSKEASTAVDSFSKAIDSFSKARLSGPINQTTDVSHMQESVSKIFTKSNLYQKEKRQKSHRNWTKISIRNISRNNYNNKSIMIVNK